MYVKMIVSVEGLPGIVLKVAEADPKLIDQLSALSCSLSTSDSLAIRLVHGDTLVIHSLYGPYPKLQAYTICSTLDEASSLD